MALPDLVWWDGYDKYGPTGFTPVAATVAGEYTITASSLTVVAALAGGGQALQFNNGDFTHAAGANFARTIGGTYIRPDFEAARTNQRAGFRFVDGATLQGTIEIGFDGTIRFYRGTTLVLTSTQTIVFGSTNCIEWDVTWHNTTGKVAIWLNGVLTSIDGTGANAGIDTCATANNYVNGWGPTVFNNFNNLATFDHSYIWAYTASGGSELPALTNPLIETHFPVADVSTDWTKGPDVLGQAYRLTTSTVTPAANSLVLRKLTSVEAGSLTSVQIVPNTTSATAKFKSVVYADNGSGTAPSGAPLASGTEVIASTAGAVLNLPLSAPLAIAATTIYWVGYITDTAISVRQFDTNTNGYRAANTYTSGIPNPAPAMTSGQLTYLIYGIMAPTSTHYTQVDGNPWLGDLSYNSSATVNNVDSFTFAPLSATPTTIYGLAVKSVLARTDAGARTANIETDSAGTISSGQGGAAISPPITYAYSGAYFQTDPATGVAWTPVAVNAVKARLKIAT